MTFSPKPLDVDDLPLDEREAGRELNALDLLNAAALRSRLEADGWTLDKLHEDINIERRRKRMGELTRAALGGAVGTILEREVCPIEPSWRQALSRQYLLMLLVPALLISAWFHAGIGRLAGRPSPMQELVVSAVDMPPYHVIGPQDVKIEQRRVDPLALASVDLVVGRQTASAVARNTVIHLAVLRRADHMTDLNTRSILTIPVRHVDAALAAALPAVVSLVFSDAKGSPVAEESSIYLLAVVREREKPFSTGTVALSRDALTRIQPLLSGRDVTVSWNPHASIARASP